MEYKGRVQCLVVRDNKILMVKHKHGNDEWYCSPGGGIEKGETPEIAAIRELKEECNVSGTIVKKTSEFIDPYDSDILFYSFHVDIGDQIPSLGYDPEKEVDNPVLVDVCWFSLNEISEIDRAFLWASGLLSIAPFMDELQSWSREISYPKKHNCNSKEASSIRDLKISDLITMQNTIQNKMKDKWKPINPENGRLSLLWMYEEMGELVAIIKKRGENDIMNDETIRSAFVEELSDVLMYFTDLMNCYSVTAEEMSEAFIKKHEKNMNRDFVTEHKNYLNNDN